MADDALLGLLVIGGVLGIFVASIFGWMAPNIATTEDVCSTQHNVLCGQGDGPCKIGVDLINKTHCTASHLPASTKAESWSLGGMIALCVLLYIIGEIIIIRKARKGEWAHTEWGFIGVNVLALLIIVTGVGAINLGQAWFNVWVTTIDWMATTLWFLWAIICVLGVVAALGLLYIFKRTLWDTFVVPAREEQEEVPTQIPPLHVPKKRMGRPKGSKNKRRVGRPKKAR